MLATMLAAALTAIVVARRYPEHAPAAGALAGLAGCNLLRAPIVRLVPTAVERYHGAKLLAVYLDGALMLGVQAIVPALALAVAVTPERRRFALAGVGVAWL